MRLAKFAGKIGATLFANAMYRRERERAIISVRARDGDLESDEYG
jgi:hypothetical protein